MAHLQSSSVNSLISPLESESTSWNRNSSSPLDDASNFDPVVVACFSILDSHALPFPMTEATRSVKVSSPRRKKKITPKFVYSSDSDPENNSKQKQVTLKEYKYKCDQCEYTTNQKSKLTRHSKIHDLKTSRGRMKCPYPKCLWCSTRMEYLDQHLQLAHGIDIEIESLNFNAEEAMNQWLNQLQETTHTKYRTNGKSKSSSKILKFLYCHRSCHFREASKGKGLRTRRKRDSINTGSLCTSRIVVTKTETAGVEVKYYKTHVGHTLEPWKVSSPCQIRRNVQKKLAKEQLLDGNDSGHPRNEILQNVLSSPSSNIADFSIYQDEQDVGACRELAVDYFNKCIQLATDSESMIRLVEILKSGFETLQREFQ